jgi:NADH:ubiquinone oxidoreductase subunit 6 (subunit J)
LTGGGAAGTIHLGTGFLRLLSTKATAGTANPIVATTENTAAIGGSLLSFFFPIIIAVLLLLLIVWTISYLFRRFARAKRPY